MVYRHYGLIVKIQSEGRTRYLLRIPDYHEKYSVPDLIYDDPEIARKEAPIYLYNCIVAINRNGEYTPAMSPPSINTYAKHWFDNEHWDVRDYKGSILIRLKAQDIKWDKGFLPLLPPNDKAMEHPLWSNLTAIRSI